MLGFAPISGQAISGSPTSLVRIAALMSASLTMAFAVNGTAGARFRTGARVEITFGLNPRLTVHQRLQSQVGISFPLEPRLRVAGKPIFLSAVPQRYEARATLARYTATALPTRYITRGQR